VASAAAAAAAVAGGLYAARSSANSEHEAPFGERRRESLERDHGDTWSRMQVSNKGSGTVGVCKLFSLLSHFLLCGF